MHRGEPDRGGEAMSAVWTALVSLPLAAPKKPERMLRDVSVADMHVREATRAVRALADDGGPWLRLAAGHCEVWGCGRHLGHAGIHLPCMSGVRL